MTRQYNLSNIRDLLTQGFTEQELRHFCFYSPDFKPLHNKISSSAGKETIIKQIIRYAGQQEKFDVLLAWAKEYNPTRYQTHQPYDRVIT